MNPLELYRADPHELQTWFYQAPEANPNPSNSTPPNTQSPLVFVAVYEAVIHTFWLIYIIFLMWNHDSTKSTVKALQERVTVLENNAKEQEVSSHAWQEQYKADCEHWEEYNRAWQVQWEVQNAEYNEAVSKIIERVESKAHAAPPPTKVPSPARVITFDIGEILGAHLKKTLGAVGCRMEYTLVPEDLPASTKVPEMVWEKSAKVNAGNVCSLLVPVGMKCYLKSMWINPQMAGTANDYYTDLFQKFFDS